MAEHGLSWVMSEVDDAGSRGVVEEVGEFDRPLHEPNLFQPDLPWGVPRKRSTGSASRLANRPRTQGERVEALIEALRRVVIDLPEVEQQTFALLNDEDDSVGRIGDVTSPPVSSIQFLPDEDSPVRRETRLDVTGPELIVARQELEQLLDSLLDEVRGGQYE